MKMLNQTSIAKTVSGQAQLMEVAATMADLEKPFLAVDGEAVDKLIQCTEAAINFFSVF